MVPVNIPIPLEKRSIVSPVNEAVVNADGTVKIESYKDKYSFVYLMDEHDNLIGASYTLLRNNFQLTDSTTAIALVLMFLVDWGRLNVIPNQLLNEIPQNTRFQMLRNYISNLINPKFHFPLNQYMLTQMYLTQQKRLHLT